MKKAVFLDRDGIINIDKSYVYKIEDFEFNEGVFEVLRYLKRLGYLLFIVTNQSGIGRGYYSESDFLKLTNWMLDEFKFQGIDIQRVYYCPHSPESNCLCRKPKIGMFEKAFSEYSIDKKNSWMIGDKPSDIKAGKKAGLSTIFLNSSTTYKDALFNIQKVLDIVQIIRK